MKPNQTVPLAVSLAPMLAPPVLIGAAIGLGLVWLFSEKKTSPPPTTIERSAPVTPASGETSAQTMVELKPKAANRRVTREDVAEALSYGGRAVPRSEAVAALQALGFKKTAAYNALLPNGRFSELLEHNSDGLIEWIG